MVDSQSIRRLVESFWRDYGVGDEARVEDAFAPWFLYKRFLMSPQEAIANSSDGKDDGGIDGFYLGSEGNYPTLWLVQAKLSPSYQAVNGGIQDLIRAVRTFSDLLGTGDTLKPAENRVLRNLRASLAGLTTPKEDLRVHFILIHLYAEPRELWSHKPRVKELEDQFSSEARSRGLGGRADLDYLGPGELQFPGRTVPREAKPFSLAFDANRVALDDGTECWYGLGRLTDLVGFYERYRTDLFAKNVRMYLYRQEETEQSPARQIRKTIQQICGLEPNPQGLTPDHFALLHNGVTLLTPSVESGEDGSILLKPGERGIFILNGCQTIYTAWHLFEQTLRKENGEAKRRWEGIKVPMRILVTSDDDLVRRVTVSNNRQNAIRPSAFYAHDPLQLELDAKFARFGIFYERQEGAFEHQRRVNDKRIQEEFDKTETPIGLEALAQAVAGATRSLPLSFSASPLTAFESEQSYHRVFTENHLQNIRWLVFLTNLFRATRFALRSIRDEAGESGAYASMSTHSLAVPAFRLLVHYIAWRRPNDDVFSYSTRAFDNRHAGMRYMKDWARRLLRSQDSGILPLLREVWFDEDREWRKYTDGARMSFALGRRRFGNADVWGDWSDLDRLEPKLESWEA